MQPLARRHHRVHVLVGFDGEVDDAGAVVGEHFGQIGEWASAITESVMDGKIGRAHV